MEKKQNHLAHETSLYLLQHANNPVDWYPWGPEALNKAKNENKPILLSIGYSACHWCHVMAHESFEDPSVAQIMNQYFVNIKVDREERPDLDKIYQLSYQLMNGQGGGWPLTVFLSPDDHVPFFVGTYFPPTTSYGRISFKDLLQRIIAVYQQKQEEIQASKGQLLNVLQQITEFANPDAALKLTHTPLDAAFTKLQADWDQQYGGFGVAPKFPHPSYLQRLLRYYLWSKANKHENSEALDIVMSTLSKMAEGGIYDQLGGGFFRYSVDRIWEIPHFEKMLYDNAQLLVIYSQAYAISKNKLFAQVIEDTANWLLREMQSPDGGFYATLDADSDHVEGKYYYWDLQEVKELLSKDEYAVASVYYGLAHEANFENHWHLKRSVTLEEISKKLSFDLITTQKLLAAARQKLLSARSKRTYPARNEKIITSWNALAIKGLVYAGFYLQRDDYIAAAQKTLRFIKQHLWLDGRLYANIQNAKLGNKGFLDDYAFLLDSILVLLQVAWNTDDLLFAKQLADDLLVLFEDKTNGGFFFTSHDSEQLIVRPKSFMDEAIPAGNSSAVLGLSRLGWLLGENRYLKPVENALKNAWQEMLTYSAAYSSLLDVLEDYLYSPEIIVIRADFHHGQPWLHAALANFNPRRMAVLISTGEQSLPVVLQEKQVIAGKTVAYICTGPQCLPPIENQDAFLQYLDNN